VEAGNSVQVTFKVTGLAPTPAAQPKGDAEIQAKCTADPKKPKIVARCTVLVVIPSGQSHALGAFQIQNTINGPAGGVYALGTTVSSTVTITITDQFAVVLDSIYNGDKVVYETFAQGQAIGAGGAAPAGTFPIILPDAALTNGIKLDYCSASTNATVPENTVTPAQAAGWPNGTAVIGGVDNVWQNRGQNGYKALMSITVEGWAVKPDYFRTLNSTGGPYNPVPFNLTDVAQP
jgi:hypothetical protein